MAKPFPDSLRFTITTREEGERWIRLLHGAGLLFHFEDNPSDVIDGSMQYIFTEADAVFVRRRVVELYELNWGPEYECPIGFALTLTEDSDA